MTYEETLDWLLDVATKLSEYGDYSDCLRVRELRDKLIELSVERRLLIEKLEDE